VAVFVATGAGSGYAPVASGTFGSMVGVALFFPLSALGSWLYLLVTVGLISLGVWAADEFERAHGKKDDGRIVIDEIVGQLLTYFPFVFLGFPAGFLWLVTGFVVFRVFDVVKPGPVRWAEQGFEGGAGVVLDDVLAGIFSALVMAALIAVLG
jgi:phosphatidylglycerophosphatase A